MSLLSWRAVWCPALVLRPARWGSLAVPCVSVVSVVAYVENKAGLTGQTVPGRRIPGHWPYPGPEELAETEPVGPDAWTFLFLLITTPRAR